jgi:hypothetical protein
MLVNNILEFTAVDLPNFAANGAIGTAPNTVDNVAAVRINQTTANISLTLPNPTITTDRVLFMVFNVGVVSVTVWGVIILPSQVAQFFWNGSTWVAHTVVNRPWQKAGVTGEATNNSNILTTDAIAHVGKVKIGNNANPISLLHLYKLNGGVTAGDDDIWIDTEGVSSSPGFSTRRGRPGTTIDPITGLPIGTDPCVDGDILGTFSMWGAIGAGSSSAVYTSMSGMRSFYKGVGTDNLSELVFFTSGLNRFFIDKNGNIGVNQPLPTSRLHVTGSVAFSSTTITANTTLNDTHSRIIVNNAAVAITINFPAANTCAGRQYVISRAATSTGTITIGAVGGQVQALAGTLAGTTTIAAHSATGSGLNICFTSDGTNWYR